MPIRKLTVFMAALFLSASATSVSAAEAFVSTTVQQIFADSGTRFGGCGALIASSLEDSTNLMGCTNFVTFDCAGAKGTSKANAQRMFDAAQLAFVTGRGIRITVTDAPDMMAGRACMATNLYVMAR